MAHATVPTKRQTREEIERRESRKQRIDEKQIKRELGFDLQEIARTGTRPR